MKRDWSAAREKVERENRCRFWQSWEFHGAHCDGPLEAAHIIGREHDKKAPINTLLIPSGWMGNVVFPDRIVPLCRVHHQMYDAHELDLLGYLTAAEEAQAVLDAAGDNPDAPGLENARRRLCPSEYRPPEPERLPPPTRADLFGDG